MQQVFTAGLGTLLAPRTLFGALFWGAVLLLAAITVSVAIRRTARRVAQHLSDTTGLGFVSAFGQLLTYLIAFILYARVVPELQALGTTLLAGVSVVSIVVGLAAQSTLGNLVAGFSLVLYRSVRVGDRIQLSSPKGLITAVIENVSLGYTFLRDEEGDEVIVPNSVMIGSVVIRTGEDR